MARLDIIGLAKRYGEFHAVRDVSLAQYDSADLVHTAVLVAFAVAMWRLAIWRMQAGLID